MRGKRCLRPLVSAVLLLCVFLVLGFSPGAKAASGRISLDVRQADLRDVLSALAIQMDMNIVLIEEPAKVTFSVQNVTPMQALELLLQTLGLSYIRDGNLLVVGSEEKLQAHYGTEQTIARFDMVYLRASQVRPLLSELGLPVKSIAFDNNPYSLWVQGTPRDLVTVKELLEAVDQFENAPFEGEQELVLTYGEFQSYAVEPARLVEMAKSAGVPLQKYITFGNRLLVFDSQILAYWNEFEKVMKELDTVDARSSSIFPFKLKHVVARDGASRLAAMGFTGVRAVTFNFPEFSKQLIVICPPELESQVYSALVTIDTAPEKINAPITSSTGKFALEELKAKRRLLAEMTSIPLSSMRISHNISGNPDHPHYVLWAHETPDNIKLLQDLVASFGSTPTPGGNRQNGDAQGGDE